MGTLQGLSRGKQAGLFGGPLLFLIFLLAPAPEGLSSEAWYTAGAGLFIATWWISEVVPIPATSLLPVVLFPILGIRSIGEATAPYANPIIFLFLGGFLIAIGMQVWDLHRRIALTIVRYIGTRPDSIVLGFMVASAFVSMWVSNTSTALMMLPIALSIIELLRGQGIITADLDARSNFELVLMLGIAYGCNIGGMGTLIGTPPNALFSGFMYETYGVEIGFAAWMMVGVPLVVVSLPVTYLLLTRMIYPIRIRAFEGGRALIDAELEKLGPMTTAERRVAGVFGLVALLWISQPLVADWMPGISDAGIAMAGALALFVLPSGMSERPFLLDWEQARELPWGVLILFGGGLSLAGAITSSGLATWIGGGVGQLDAWPTLALLVLVVALIIFLTEITSNTATAAAFLPILASVAIGIGENPILFAAPAVLAASCAFMLPVATPPNAIVYGASFLTIAQMARAGFWLNLVFIFLITLLAYSLLGWAFGVEPGVIPPVFLQGG